MDLDPEEQADDLYDFIQGIIGIDWISTVFTAVIVIAITAVVARFAAKFLRKLLSRDNSLLPSSSIFINITRVVVWCIGASVMFSSCFGIDVSAAITALGIGGIAVSLGFQDTLSNLIGGIQVSITGLVEPGDHIEVGGQRGVVRDVTWRHTAIENTLGEQIVIPNSVINTSALLKLRPVNVVSLPVVVTTFGKDLADVAQDMQQAAADALAGIGAVEQMPRVRFSEVTDYGYKATLTFSMKDAGVVGDAKDAALRAVAPFVHTAASSASGGLSKDGLACVGGEKTDGSKADGNGAQ